MSWPSKVFEFNPAGLNWPYGVLVLDIMLVPLLVFDAIGHKVYLLSAVFGVLLAAIADPGGGYGHRASRVAVVALIGAGLTALGFGIGGDAWGWLVLAAFAVTLVAGLAVTFGVQSFIVALVLNVWFIVALGSRSASLLTSPATSGLRWSPGPAGRRSGSRRHSSGGWSAGVRTGRRRCWSSPATPLRACR
jgi:hypothetical protein